MGKRKNKVQVSKDHYIKNYDDLNRWISYWYQISLVKKFGNKKVLEIGVGNKTVSNYLKKIGFELTTFDIDPNLKPDFVGSVTKLPFKMDSFDLVLCFEVLEHLPYSKVKKALKELNRVTSENVVISVFAANVGASLAFKIPFVRLVRINFKLPMFWSNHNYNGEHYWEAGKNKYPVYKLKDLINKSGFEIVDELFPALNIYHHFFVLKKKN